MGEKQMRMDSLQVPTKQRPIKIQPMDAKFAVISDDEEEYGLGYQNTLVRYFICAEYKPNTFQLT